MINIEQKVRNILYGLDKYNYCLDSELEDSHKQIIGLLREAYLTGKGNGWSEALCQEPRITFEEWLKREL